MADTGLTTAGGSHHGSTPSSLTTEEVREMEARVNRPVKVKRIDLESFDERKIKQRTPEEIEQKRQQLISLTRRGVGPLRLQEVEVAGNMVLYLGPRTWGQYFYENLWLFPAEKEVRRREVRVAIERYIRPWLEQKAEVLRSANGGGKTPSAVDNRKGNAQTACPKISNLELLDRLHCRVYTKRIDSRAFYGNEPKDPKILKVDDACVTNHMRTAFHGITTVPDGLSIARIAPFKVMADVRIMMPETRLLADKYVDVGGNGTPCKEMRSEIEGKNAVGLQLENYYYHLLDFYGKQENRIVLEVQGVEAKHWQAAYSAAKRWMTKNPASLMLVPLYETKVDEAFRNKRHDNQAWSSSIIRHLNSTEVLQIKPGNRNYDNHESTGNAAAHGHPKRKSL